MEPRDNSGGVDEGVLKVRVAREELRLQEPRVGNVSEKGDVHAVSLGDVLETDSFEERHGEAGGGVKVQGKEGKRLPEGKRWLVGDEVEQF